MHVEWLARGKKAQMLRSYSLHVATRACRVVSLELDNSLKKTKKTWAEYISLLYNTSLTANPAHDVLF